MKKIKTGIICTMILCVILLCLTSFEYVLLSILGLQYDHFRSLCVFFILYVFLEIPLSLLTKGIPFALKSIGMLQTSKGIFAFSLHFGCTFVLIEGLDRLLHTVFISTQGAVIFAFVTACLNAWLRDKEVEPPNSDHKEFEQLSKKFLSKK